MPELRAFQHELSTEHPILRVGVRGPLPIYFSPAWACTDNEHRAVELLFESLVKLIPDEEGGFRYLPGLSESRPKVVPLGRQFELPRKAVWSDGKRLNSTDIDFSLRLLQNGRGVGRSRVWGDLLVASETRDPFRVTLRMKQGFLDPLALMTFKILPRDHDVNSEVFAKRPVTSGPFRLDLSRHSDETNRECLFFVANLSYGLRPTKKLAPPSRRSDFTRITTKRILPRNFAAAGWIWCLILRPSKHKSCWKNRTPIVLPLSFPHHRRRHPIGGFISWPSTIANYPTPNCGAPLAFAINREALLDKHFRAALKVPFHRALNGPFPVGSWACNSNVRDRSNKNSLDLHDADRAKNLSVGVEKPAGLTLKYPQGDTAVDEAMKDLCAQVKSLTGVVLSPTPCDPYQLREDVEGTQNYDLAYYHYDFPDESYWLAPLLGPPPGGDGSKKMFRFTNADLAKLLAGTESYRDFDMVRKYQWLIHKLLLKEMPFIPLWQLDPLLAYRRDVQPAALDLQLVFRDIEEWRLRRR